MDPVAPEGTGAGRPPGFAPVNTTGDRSGHPFGATGASHGGLGVVGHATVRPEGAGLQVGLDETGAGDHHVNTGRPQFRSQGCEQAVEGVLAGAVAAAAEQGGDAGQAFDDDDGPPSPAIRPPRAAWVQ